MSDIDDLKNEKLFISHNLENLYPTMVYLVYLINSFLKQKFH